jgi:malate dehydrogenase
MHSNPSGRVCVVGAGVVGATTAYTLATAGVDVTLVDAADDLAAGHGIDIRHATAHASHALGEGAPTADVSVAQPTPEAAADADCVVMAASAPRPEGARSRMAFLEANREVVAEVTDWLSDVDPRPVVVVSNPLDRLVHLTYERLGWPRERIVGYSLSETARVADAVADLRDVPHAAVRCPVIGEHGDGIVPVFSRATVDGDPADLSAEERQSVLDYARDVALDVIDLRGFDETSRWVTARGVARLCSGILAGGPDAPVGLCTPLDGEYGHEDVSVGVPVTLSAAGVETIHEWDLAEAERERFDAAVADIRASL